MRSTHHLLVTALVALGVLAAAQAFAHENSLSTQTPASDAPPNESHECWGTKTVRISDTVAIPTTASLLEVIVTADGRALRPLWMSAQYFSGTANCSTYIGETRVHRLVPIDSTEVIDLSARDLDLGLADPSAGPDSYRSFSVTVRPAAGRNWGDVREFKADLVIQATMLPD